jgi:hypothetical protein
MRAFSLSPGGLLLPYHLGALSALTELGALQPSTDVVGGSSAGAIAAMSYGCGLKPTDILEATVSISDKCHILGRARGNLLPLLEQEMESRVGEEEFRFLNEERDIGIGYKEIFPRQKSFLQTEFENREDLFRAVSWSCMFPFFATNWPCSLDTSSDGYVPRLMVDGFFSVPRERFGCPEFESVDRTVAISVFPKNLIGLDAFDEKDCISPSTDSGLPLQDLFRIATQASSREELTKVYESGWQDAEAWCSRERKREQDQDRTERDLRLQGF